MSTAPLPLLRKLQLSLAGDLVKLERAFQHHNNPTPFQQNHLAGKENEEAEDKESKELDETGRENEFFLEQALKRFSSGLFALFYQNFHTLQLDIEVAYEKGDPLLSVLVKMRQHLKTFQGLVKDREDCFGGDYDAEIFNPEKKQDQDRVDPALDNMKRRRDECFVVLEMLDLSLSRAIFFEAYKLIKLLNHKKINDTTQFLKVCPADPSLKTALSSIIQHQGVLTTQAWLKEFEEKIAWIVERAERIDAIKGEWERVQYFSQEMSSVMEFSSGICVGQNHEWLKEPVHSVHFRSGFLDMKRQRYDATQYCRAFIKARFEAGSLVRQQLYLSLYEKGQCMPNCSMIPAVSKTAFQTEEAFLAGAFDHLAHTLKQQSNLIGAGLYFEGDKECHFIACKIVKSGGASSYLCLDNNDGKYRFKTIEMMQQFFVQSFKILGYDNKKFKKYHLELARDPSVTSKVTPASNPLSSLNMGNIANRRNISAMGPRGK